MRTVLSETDLAPLVARSLVRRYRAGSWLFYEGDASDRVFIVRSGRVKIVDVTDDGREVILALCGPGTLLGELSAIDGEPRSAAAIALDPVEAVLVDSVDFVAWLDATPGAATAILRLMAGRLRMSDRRRVEFTALDVVGRVASRLVELADEYGEPEGAGVRIALPITQQDLAAYTGSSREAVSKALQSLRSRGLVETHRRGFSVLDLEGLRNRAR